MTGGGKGTAFAVFAGVRLRRRRDGAPTFLAAAALLVITAAPYAPIAALIELRVLAFAVPVLAVLAAVATACQPVPEVVNG